MTFGEKEEHHTSNCQLFAKANDKAIEARVTGVLSDALERWGTIWAHCMGVTEEIKRGD